ncbi:hypothetical protein Q2T46_11670 [Thermoanaerobacterium sp. CMT5567-10]|uniref:hypothetical protein n=1 Tax=Thermoanaerobacterium sp. CMT5567-10 TaxID=3061989 RepID=UPI0026DFEEE2|nr:hypothetical protein [Thermoanaerobacterium sp. CMT5567-10]WKV08185.1 hypothetical protein Q2T46_11670 [Thermoanaerobacterium sp. CMT5567-10]
MKIQIICEHCGKIVELLPNEENYSYVSEKLEKAKIHCEPDVQIEIENEMEEIKNMRDVSDIDVYHTIEGIEFTCEECGNSIILTELN